MQAGLCSEGLAAAKEKQVWVLHNILCLLVAALLFLHIFAN
jgi:hypothetical protein